MNYIFKFSFLKEKANELLKYALKGAAKHNVDISKTLTDAIRLLKLEKYVY